TLLRLLRLVVFPLLILSEGVGSRAERQEHSKQQTNELLHRDCFSLLLLPMICRCGNLAQNWLLRKSQYPDLIWRQFFQKGSVNQNEETRLPAAFYRDFNQPLRSGSTLPATL